MHLPPPIDLSNRRTLAQSLRNSLHALLQLNIVQEDQRAINAQPIIYPFPAVSQIYSKIRWDQLSEKQQEQRINLSNRRTLVQSLNTKDYKTAVEVGVRLGWFSKYILDHTSMKVFCIDPWENNVQLSNAESALRECSERLAPYGERASMVKGYSQQEAEKFSDESIDFVYIDGLHDYESVKGDINGWWSKVSQGGILSGHDFNRRKWKGVVVAVEEFCNENNTNCYLTGTVGNAIQSFSGDIDEYDGDELSWVIIKGDSDVV